MDNLMLDKLRVKTIFVGLSDEQVERVTEAGTEVSAVPGDIIVREHEIGDALYVILSGSVEIRREAPGGKKLVTSLSGCDALRRQYEGDFFGEMSLLDVEPRSATAVAVDECRLLVLSRTALEKLFAEDAAIHIIMLTNIARILSHRLRAGMERDI